MDTFLRRHAGSVTGVLSGFDRLLFAGSVGMLANTRGMLSVLYLLKVNPRRYEEVSQMELRLPGKNEPLLEYPCWAAPILSHGLLYVRGHERLVCLELIPHKK